MVLLTLLAGYLLLQPRDYQNLLQSSLWSVFSSANFYFYHSVGADYFSTDSKEMPLLHLWSLGVEEQFYLLWPTLLAVIFRLSLWIQMNARSVRLVVVGMLVAFSLVAAQSLMAENAKLAYYMLPTRAWELMIEAWVALFSNGQLVWSKRSADFAALCGASLVAASFVFLTENASVPGIAAVPAVVGAAMLITSGPYTIIGQLLSKDLAVKVGLISYSAYLFHWPLLAFVRYCLIDITPWVGAVVLIATFILAELTYRYI